MTEPPDIVTKFKEKIGYQDYLEEDKLLGSVVAAWPLPTTAPQLANENWQIIANSIVSYHDYIKGNWTLKHDDQIISVQIAVSSQGSQAIRELFLIEATSTMMVESPYSQTTTLIGSLSVFVEGEDLTSYLWTYHNVLFHIEGMFTKSDIEGLALWIQAIAEKGLVDDLSPQLPPLEFIKIEPAAQLSVNDSFTAQVVLREVTLNHESSYRFDFRHEPFESLELLSEDGNTASFKTLAPGMVDISVQVINPRTLLSITDKARIEVTD